MSNTSNTMGEFWEGELGPSEALTACKALESGSWEYDVITGWVVGPKPAPVPTPPGKWNVHNWRRKSDGREVVALEPAWDSESQ